MSEQDLNIYEEELLQILQSNLVNKNLHVQRLANHYPNFSTEIIETFALWSDMNQLEAPMPSPEMDASFYEMLNSQTDKTTVLTAKKVAPQIQPRRNNVFTMRRIAAALLFLAGVTLGNWVDFGSASPVNNNEDGFSPYKSIVTFASLEESPLASDRIKGITRVKTNENPNDKMLEALNKVICTDPNTNVRLSAIETLVLFSELPRAREILVRAIPYQTSSVVQLELADIMLGLEESNSAQEWEQLFATDKVETEVKMQLKNTLKRIL